MENDSDTNFLFGDFELSATNRRLLKQGETVALNSKTFDLLLFLVENHGRVVTKDELLGMVWEGQFVEENNLTVQIAALRKIFGDKKDEHQFIATVHRKGYKFVADVQHVPVENNLRDFSALMFRSPTDKSFESSRKILGRAREISAVCSLLRDAECRLITLSGAGGSGKTLLARAVAEQIKDDFADGVYFVELAPISQPELLTAAIANALDVKESGEKSLQNSLSEYLKDKKTLLILDNFEQIISAAGLIENLTSESDFLKILITSRISLRLNIESEFAVSPLIYPPTHISVSTDNLEKYPAVELFARKAHSVREKFLFSEENSNVISDICRRLDGLPLAIELAAARVRLLSPQSIYTRLSDSLSLLSGGAKNLPEHQQTIRGTIQWSYDLLEENEQILFRQLSVFNGGFSIEAAEAIAGKNFSNQSDKLLSDSSIEKSEKNLATAVDKTFNVLDLLTSLIENNLLFVKEQKDGEVRLKMLEVVREFAAERLETTGETEKFIQKHARYFLKLAKEAEPNLSGNEGAHWLDKLELENDNLRAALRRFLECDAESAARLAAAIREFWASHSYLTEGCDWLVKVLEKSDKTPSEIRFKLLYGLGFLARQKGDYKLSRTAHEQGLKDGEAVGDKRQIGWSYRGLGAVAFRQNDLKSAREYIEKALRVSRDTDDQPGIANALNFLGDICLAEDNPAAARPPLEECLAILQELGYKQSFSSVLNNLGVVCYRQDDFAAASNYFSEAMATAQELGQKSIISLCLDGFAALTVAQGKPDLAACLAGSAENLRETIGYQIEPSELVMRRDYETKIRRALDEKSFIAAYEKGKTLDLNEAVAIAGDSIRESNEQDTEIIIETHKFERVFIEEYIEE